MSGSESKEAPSLSASEGAFSRPLLGGLLAGLGLIACSRDSTARSTALDPSCDRGALSTPAQAAKDVRDASFTPNFRAARLKALFASETPPPQAEQALLFVLIEPTDHGQPMPQELVDAARALNAKPAVRRIVDARLASLQQQASALEQGFPQGRIEALTKVGRIEQRGGRMFTVDADLREKAEAVAPPDTSRSESERDSDSIYESWLGCRQAEPRSWTRTRESVDTQQNSIELEARYPPVHGEGDRKWPRRRFTLARLQELLAATRPAGAP